MNDNIEDYRIDPALKHCDPNYHPTSEETLQQLEVKQKEVIDKEIFKLVSALNTCCAIDFEVVDYESFDILQNEIRKVVEGW